MEVDGKTRVPLPLVRCHQMVCKGMYIYKDEYHTPEDEQYRTNDFWCLRTQSVIGPDGDLVTLSRCASGRECYEQL